MGRRGGSCLSGGNWEAGPETGGEDQSSFTQISSFTLPDLKKALRVLEGVGRGILICLEL